MSSTGICDSEGLKGPPTGTPSSVNSSASNSLSPHMPTFGRRAPLSEPAPVSSPTTSWSASASVWVPRRRSSWPVTTAVAFGTLIGLRGVRVAETTIS